MIGELNAHALKGGSARDELAGHTGMAMWSILKPNAPIATVQERRRIDIHRRTARRGAVGGAGEMSLKGSTSASHTSTVGGWTWPVWPSARRPCEFG